MGRAYKCDRCGKLFEKSTQSFYIQQPSMHVEVGGSRNLCNGCVVEVLYETLREKLNKTLTTEQCWLSKRARKN